MKKMAVLLSKILLLPVLIGALLFYYLMPPFSSTGVSSGKGIRHLSEITQAWTDKNGARVYVVNQPDSPVIDIEILFDAGSTQEGIPGLAYLVNRLVKEGPSGYSQEVWVDKLEALGVRFSVSAERDLARLHFRLVPDNRHPENTREAVALLSQIVESPAFREEDIARLRAQQAVLLSQESQEPSILAEKTWDSLVFSDPAYAHWPHGVAEHLSALTSDQVTAFFAQHYRPEKMVIAIVGDLAHLDARELSEQLSDACQHHSVSLFSIPQEVVIEAPAVVHHIEYPSSQTHLGIGAMAVNQHHADYVPLRVGTHIFSGSGLSSLLFQRVRGDLGLVYNVGGRLVPLLHDGFLYVVAQTRAEEAQKTKAAILEVWKHFSNNGPTEEELKHAKANLKSTLWLQVTDNASFSELVAYLGYYRLPLSYLSDLERAIDEVTALEIQQAWKTHFPVDKLTIVTVGPT